ncbi:MAG: right-handed parallel beta-helix repeat-containing protein [Candidatus Azobacteroides sp.]|nr:right-handed parallel beta-helix repeat-containing protein [Candidatus Azobacteroides sp.]
MKKLKLFLFACLVAITANATVYYVDPDGDNTDGLSWETAFQSVKDALAGTTAGNHEVWVKQGTYVSSTVLSWKPGVSFYGGFTGTETEREQRNPDPSLTIIEGTRENGVMNTPQTAYTTIWDGFTIQKGKASGGGGGILMQRNSILQNCIVQDNEATNYGGGGIFIQDAVEGPVQVIDCIIRNNTLAPTTNDRNGAGIVVRSGALGARISGCIIEGNVLEGGTTDRSNGGGISMYAGILENTIIQNNKVTKPSGANCNGAGIWIYIEDLPVTINNCVIANNFADAGNGAGAFIAGKAGYTGNAVFTNCHIVNNEISYASYGGAGIFYQIPANLTNCVFWGNTAPGSTVHNLRTPNDGNTIKNCAFDNRANSITWGIETVDCIYLEAENTGEETDKLYPSFASPTNFTGVVETDEQKASLEAADWSLTEKSACIDAGTTVTLTTDIIGTERPQNNLYDIGAYEYNGGVETGLGENILSKMSIYGENGNIVIRNGSDKGVVFVYNLTGTLIGQVDLSEGTTYFPVNMGLYIVKVNNTVGKVTVK